MFGVACRRPPSCLSSPQREPGSSPRELRALRSRTKPSGLGAEASCISIACKVHSHSFTAPSRFVLSGCWTLALSQSDAIASPVLQCEGQFQPRRRRSRSFSRRRQPLALLQTRQVGKRRRRCSCFILGSTAVGLPSQARAELET